MTVGCTSYPRRLPVCPQRYKTACGLRPLPIFAKVGIIHCLWMRPFGIVGEVVPCRDRFSLDHLVILGPQTRHATTANSLDRVFARDNGTTSPHQTTSIFPSEN